MIENNTKTSKEVKPSDDFRETLLKSGLDISAFQSANSKLHDKKPLADCPIDFTETENKFSEKSLAQSILESPETSKKVLPKISRRQSLTAISGIAAIIILQSVFQFSFIQDESHRSAENLTKNALPIKENNEKIPLPEMPPAEVSETEQTAKIEAKTANKKAALKNPTQPEKKASKTQTEIRETPVRTASRKKEQRESNAERLRRAEKILTGI